MIGLLLSGFEAIGAFVVWAIENVINVLLEGLYAVFSVAVAVLPSMPEPVSPPGVIEYVNWFFPVGALVSIATTMLTAYVVWLGVAWIFRKAGEL